MELTPYLIFTGRCREALDSYADILGGSVTMAMPRPDAEDRLSHCRVEAGGQVLHGMDGSPGDATPHDSTVLLTLDSTGEARRVFGALMTGDAQVTVPVAPAAFGGVFGMGVDRFGVRWVITGADHQTAER